MDGPDSNVLVKRALVQSKLMKLDTINSIRRKETVKIRVPFLFYPDMNIKVYWDLWMTLVLVVSCIHTPVDIAFSNSEDHWTANDIMGLVMDIFFLIDILFCFFSAYEDIDEDIIDNRKKIAIHYLSGWFAIDVLAILPIQLFFSSAGKTSNVNEMIRIVRLGKLSKLLKLLKLLRVLKVLKNQSKIMDQMNSFVTLDMGINRIMFFFAIFLMLSHIVSCLWIISANMMDDEEVVVG